jgi:hypothetical protein
MTSFLVWYFLLTLLGWLTFPLTFALFPALTDRGYTLARAAGLLIWAYVFWLFASLGIAQNDLGGIILALAVLIALSIWSLVTHHSSIITFLKSNAPSSSPPNCSSSPHSDSWHSSVLRTLS